MENVKQTVKIECIRRDGVDATIITKWDEQGTWFERGRQVWGLVGKRSVKAMSFFSVVDAQNYADEIGAEFRGIKAA